MMTIRKESIFLLTAISLTACNSAEPSLEIRHQIDQAVIAYGASTRLSTAVQTCVDAEVVSRNLDHLRMGIDLERKILGKRASDAEGRAHIAQIISQTSNLVWFYPASSSLELPSKAQMELNKAIKSALEVTPKEHEGARILEKAAVPSPLVLVHKPVVAERTEVVESQNCPDVYSISEAAISDGLAFVETSSICGGTCGEGQIIALRRVGVGAQWTVIAAAPTWVS